MDIPTTPGRRWRAVPNPFAGPSMPINGRTVSMLMPYDETDPKVPTVGSPLSCPVDGGQNWFTFGTIVATGLLDGYVEIIVAVADPITGPTDDS